jgi:hypothetical protein
MIPKMGRRLNWQIASLDIPSKDYRSSDMNAMHTPFGVVYILVTSDMSS